jgi:hypothetical protein
MARDFRLPDAMRLLRVRPRGRYFDFRVEAKDPVVFAACLAEMSKILTIKGISPDRAKKAIRDALAAAADHQLSSPRVAQLRANEDYQHGSLDELTSEIRAVEIAVSKLPPACRRELDERLVAVLDREWFDTESFEIIARMLGQVLGEQLRLIERWETISADIRIEVEQEVPRWKRPTSIVRWLARLAYLLKRRRPAPTQGAPRSINYVFVERMAHIWESLGLRAGRQYDFYSGKHVASPFQRFCAASLKAFGDERPISARQISRIKESTRRSR